MVQHIPETSFEINNALAACPRKPLITSSSRAFHHPKFYGDPHSHDSERHAQSTAPTPSRSRQRNRSQSVFN